jgi:hypothetical protein
MKRRWVVSLGFAFGLWVARVPAQETGWRPVPARTSTPPAASQVIAATSDRAPVRSGPVAFVSSPSVAVTASRTPAAALERPVPIAVTPQRPALTAVSYAPPGPIIRCQDPGPPAVPPPGVPLVPDDRYNCGVVPGPPPPGGGDPFLGGRIGPLLTETNPQRSWFQSDHAFDSFASPVTNPFLAEDPRALTELRPIFMFQGIPNSNPLYQGGNMQYFGVQGRLAITDRWSIVMQKLGGLAVQPGNNLPDESGFSELWIGPKFTFWRNDCTGTLAAFGLTFQIPVGSEKVFQDTGDLSLAPYVSFAQSFGKSSFGTFNVMGTTGYSFSTDNQRSDYFYSQLHLDYDVANLHKIYPLVELNWIRYTSNGGARAQDFEGGDLINFGANNVSGNNFLSLAFGARYKFTECVQMGAAFEFPVSGRKDLMDYRVTVDLIFRY